MNPLGTITVEKAVANKLKKLEELAYNLWWTWNPEVLELFSDIDRELWLQCQMNPVRFLNEVSPEELEEKGKDPDFAAKLREAGYLFDSYMGAQSTWFSRNFPDVKNKKIAYFSAEYGFTEALPIYSGGLGVLAGDHCKSASDLGVPLVGVGLFYNYGYFTQQINAEGMQEAHYSRLDIRNLPIRPALDKSGKQAMVCVQMADRNVCARVWEVKVGRVPVYLLDSDVQENSPRDREITSRLYTEDQEVRLQQEILLGIGGLRALEVLNLQASAFHLNEGHSAFLGIELIRKLMTEKGLDFDTAREAAMSCISFTTHTPVPAGNDVFPQWMVDKYLSPYWDQPGLNRHQFMGLGFKSDDNIKFNMTVLALKVAGRRNGVSELHGSVTRKLFSSIWPAIPEDEVPIRHVTNGIHTLTWLARPLKKLFDRYLGQGWETRVSSAETWKAVDDIPDEELWEVHMDLKRGLIESVRKHLTRQRQNNKEAAARVDEAGTALSPDALTIGFARRFATYKRADLIFRDMGRILSLLNNPERPVQLIFAGKAHPADRPAQELIMKIHQLSRQEELKGKVVILENYDMNLARRMVQGVDVWLNNPRRPLEASGTSGQKACVNGVLNLSVLDGWWCEGFNGSNGWSFGGESCAGESEFVQDNLDSQSLCSILENEIIPLYYERDEEGVPKGWIRVVKEAFRTLPHRFNTHRMVQEYTLEMYVPSFDRAEKMASDSYERAKSLSAWKSRVEKSWPYVRISLDRGSGAPQDIKLASEQRASLSALVKLADIEPSDVKVEVCYGPIDRDRVIKNPQTVEMRLAEQVEASLYRYAASLDLVQGREYGYTFRVIPCHPDILSPFEMGLVKWAIS